jgi:hypothetical protein
MKRLLTVLVFCFPLITFAQIEKGNFLVSGNLMYQKNAYNESFNYSSSPVEMIKVEIGPYLGYFVSPRVAIGVYSSYMRNQTKQVGLNQFSSVKSVLEALSVGPFVRYYHPIGDKFYVFAQGDISYGKNQFTNYLADPSAQPQKSKVTTTTIAIRPGISYFITKRLAVEVILGSIAYTKSNFANNEDLNGFTFEFITRGLSPGVTFTF